MAGVRQLTATWAKQKEPLTKSTKTITRTRIKLKNIITNLQQHIDDSIAFLRPNILKKFGSRWVVVCGRKYPMVVVFNAPLVATALDYNDDQLAIDYSS